MTSQQFLICDSSNATNFKSWASALSNFIRSAGWTNSSDTGQLNGAGGGNWAGVSTVPGSGAYYYEIFQPGDGLQTFYLRVEYGNSTGATNSPAIKISAGTSTNGAGTLTGFFTTVMLCCNDSYTAPSTTTQYECDFSGDSGRLSILMWRNAPNNAPQSFAVQRSLNASGTTYGTPSTGYVSLWAIGHNVGNSSIGASYQSLLFGVGAGPFWPSSANQANNASGWPVINLGNMTFNSSLAFNGQIPCWFLQPCVGIFDYPSTVLGIMASGDIPDGVPFTIANQYGQTKTYIPTRAGYLNTFSFTSAFGNARYTLLVEYD